MPPTHPTLAAVLLHCCHRGPGRAAVQAGGHAPIPPLLPYCCFSSYLFAAAEAQGVPLSKLEAMTKPFAKAWKCPKVGWLPTYAHRHPRTPLLGNSIANLAQAAAAIPETSCYRRPSCDLGAGGCPRRLRAVAFSMCSQRRMAATTTWLTPPHTALAQHARTKTNYHPLTPPSPAYLLPPHPPPPLSPQEPFVRTNLNSQTSELDYWLA